MSSVLCLKTYDICLETEDLGHIAAEALRHIAAEALRHIAEVMAEALRHIARLKSYLGATYSYRDNNNRGRPRISRIGGGLEASCKALCDGV